MTIPIERLEAGLAATQQRAASEGATDSPPTPQTGSDSAQELARLLALHTVGLTISSARIVGAGGDASADLYLSDGSAITFSALREFGKPTTLALEIAAATGAIPKLTSALALRAVSLLRSIAERVETFSGDQIAMEWGRAFLADAPRLDIDMTDQAQRWDAFSRLRNIDPFADARDRGSSIARSCLVLVDADDRRWVRTSWFRAVVRQEDGTVSPSVIANRMQRVGWLRPGKEGRVTARRPGFPEKDVQAFYIVPAAWGDVLAEADDADTRTKADEGSHSRDAHAHAHALILRQPSSGRQPGPAPPAADDPEVGGAEALLERNRDLAAEGTS